MDISKNQWRSTGGYTHKVQTLTFESGRKVQIIKYAGKQLRRT